MVIGGSDAKSNGACREDRREPGIDPAIPPAPSPLSAPIALTPAPGSSTTSRVIGRGSTTFARAPMTPNPFGKDPRHCADRKVEARISRSEIRDREPEREQIGRRLATVTGNAYRRAGHPTLEWCCRAVVRRGRDRRRFWSTGTSDRVLCGGGSRAGECHDRGDDQGRLQCRLHRFPRVSPTFSY